MEILKEQYEKEIVPALMKKFNYQHWFRRCKRKSKGLRECNKGFGTNYWTKANNNKI